MKIRMVPVGGRIKSAAVGLNVFNSGSGNFQDQMKRTREHPPVELLNAFFPSDNARLKQMMRGIGFYRPMLKTDQGMGGNFLPFHIGRSFGGLRETDLSLRTIVREEGLIIPEMYLEHNGATLRELRKAFQSLDFRSTYRIIEPLLEHSRVADKGRTPFFFIRPALLSSPIVFRSDIIQKVTSAVEELFGKAERLSQVMSGQAQTNNSFLYFLADVFVTTQGEVTVEKLHFPDVGFFMTELELQSSIALETQNIVHGIRNKVFNKLLERINSRVVYIITRNEVLANKEDVLEILEIRSISKKLEEHGIRVEVKSVSEANEVPKEAVCLLMNLGELDRNVLWLLTERSRSREITCYPNPYLQVVSKGLTGLRETNIPVKFIQKFMGLIDCNPENGVAAEKVMFQVDAILSRSGIWAELLHVVINATETVPVHRRIHHSWKQLANRVRAHQGDEKLENSVSIAIRELPINSQNSLVTSSTGPRLHSFRFTFTAE